MLLSWVELLMSDMQLKVLWVLMQSLVSKTCLPDVWQLLNADTRARSVLALPAAPCGLVMPLQGR